MITSILLVVLQGSCLPPGPGDFINSNPPCPSPECSASHCTIDVSCVAACCAAFYQDIASNDSFVNSLIASAQSRHAEALEDILEEDEDCSDECWENHEPFSPGWTLCVQDCFTTTQNAINDINCLYAEQLAIYQDISNQLNALSVLVAQNCVSQCCNCEW